MQFKLLPLPSPPPSSSSSSSSPLPLLPLITLFLFLFLFFLLFFFFLVHLFLVHVSYFPVLSHLAPLLFRPPIPMYRFVLSPVLPHKSRVIASSILFYVLHLARQQYQGPLRVRSRTFSLLVRTLHTFLNM